ncbi:MAG TPA: GH3 auxin-responsive promoter family protein, partial [Verrucomicrobiae bacterium]|nr:GH3 auxin-responsive promoter family protein [Verrucomicrobiae bacterium]
MDLTKWLYQYSLALGGKYFSLRFAQDTKHAGEINRRVLKEILSANAGTVYGTLYGFAGIENLKQYKENVPLTGYTDYQAYIERIANGEEKVLTAEPVKYFGLSSGTTGKQKLIPTTKKGQRLITMSMMFLQQGLLFEALPKARAGGKGCLLMNIVQTGTTPAGIPTGAATSGGAKSMQKMMPHFWTSPLEVLQIGDQMIANYLHLLFALQDRTLAYLGAPFPSLIVQLFALLEESWPELVADLKLGTISARLEIDPGLRDTLQRKLRPQPRRAEE